jgi:hypothetical protein
MKYKYPKINNWLVFKKKGFNEYEVTDYLNDSSYTFGGGIARFAKRLDGKTDPFTISENLSHIEVKMMLRELERYNLLRNSRVLSASLSGLYYTLWTPNARNSRHSLSKVLNGLLQILFLPVFIYGCLTFFTVLPDLRGPATVAFAIAGVLAGMTFHEIAHAIASLSYGGSVFEVGAMLKLPFPGAYVLMDYSSVKGCLKRTQISAAGIEANLLLAGISWLLAALLPQISNGFFYVAILNTEMALMNLLLVDGLDGAGIMSDLLGIESIGKTAKDYCKSMIKHAKLRLPGGRDAVFSTMCVSTLLVQPVHLVLFALNILVIALWIT